MSIQIHIIGLGIAQTAMLSELADMALNRVQWVVGSARQLDVVRNKLSNNVQTALLPKLSELTEWVNEKEQAGVTDIAVLASGDPLYFGIGRWFGRHFNANQLQFYPGVSSVQGACHALGLSLQDADVISLHGRPLNTLRKNITNHQTLVILTDKNSQPHHLAQECLNAGFESSTITVCELLGYKEEKITSFSVNDLIQNTQTFDSLHVSIIQTKGVGGVQPSFPGIPDDHFETGAPAGKGMITKREVRLSILSLMQPSNDDIIWDIGAGCGSVAVELAYWNKTAKIYAIEQHPDRLHCLSENQQRFGVVSQLNIIEGRAPEALDSLPNANKVFIGGSDGELDQLLIKVWKTLPDNGMLVCSSVTENTKHLLISFLQSRENAQDANIETLQIAINKGGSLAGQLVYRPSLPVTLFKFIKRQQPPQEFSSHEE
jgi:precorrin-6Y C5,15-methyltransferase (decarboxylating)